MSESVNYIGMKATFKGNKTPLHLTVRLLGDGSHTSLDACMTTLQQFKNLQFATMVTGTAMFGEDNDTPVATLSGTWLYYFLDIIQTTLNHVNIQDRSDFDYTPHVSFPKDFDLSTVPDECVLGPLYVKWDGKAYPVVV